MLGPYGMFSFSLDGACRVHARCFRSSACSHSFVSLFVTLLQAFIASTQMPLFIWAQCRCAKGHTFSPRRPPMRSSLRHAGRLCQCMHTESALRQAGVFSDRRASTCMKLQAGLLLLPYCFPIQFALQPRNASPVLGTPCDSSTRQHDRVR